MLIDRNIAKYIVFCEDNTLEGVLTDGDFRRWLLNQTTIDLNQPVVNISNKKFKFALFNDDPINIESALLDDVEVLPLLDNQQHLVAIARKLSDTITIGDFTIDTESPTFIIAEIGNNHNGSLELAKKLIDLAVEAGANCAKFQMRSMHSLYHNGGNANDISEDLGSQYTLDLLSRFQLSPEELLIAFDYCKKQGIIPLCTPWDIESLTVLERYGMQAYKVASADLTNHDLLKALAKTQKPLLCSTGMSIETEILEAVRLLKHVGARYVFLHCNSTYPAPFKDVNLNYVDRLKQISGSPVGYSGHERGIHVAISELRASRRARQ